MIKYMIFVDSDALEADDEYFADIAKIDDDSDEVIEIMTKDQYSLYYNIKNESPSEYLDIMLNDPWMCDYFSKDDLIFDSLKEAKERRQKHINEAIERHT